MVNKLIVLGIDGMDWDVVMRYRQHLPNLYAMMERNGFPRLRSVFPADRPGPPFIRDWIRRSTELSIL